MAYESGDGGVGDDVGDMRRGVGTVGTKPVGCPVERAEEGARGDRGIGRPASALRRGDGGEHLVERAVLTVVEDLVFAAEVVVEVAGRQIGGDGDVAHAGGGEAAVAERARGRFEDGQPPRLGAK